MSDWRSDLSRSAYAFATFAWPAVAAWCGAGELKPVESTSAEGFVRDLDVLAGIDAWQLLVNRGYMRGIASRMQAGDRDWRTFTIRRSRDSGARTEFEKRVHAIQERDHGALYPALTVHGYVATWDKGPLMSAAVMRTVDLYGYIVDNEPGVPRNRTGNATFYCPTWRQLQTAGLDVRVWTPPTSGLVGA